MLSSLSGQAHWIWIGFGVLICAGELLTPGVFLLWFGLAMIATGLLLFITPLSFSIALLIFCALAVIFVLLGRKVYGTAASDGEQPFLNRRADALVGRTFTLASPIRTGEGEINVNDTRWKVRGPDMPAGARIKVMRVEDATVLIIEQA